MSDRQRELLRQRALVREHLEWLDREIAGTTGAPPPAPDPIHAATDHLTVATAPTPASAGPADIAPAAPIATTPAADTILDEYRVEPRAVQLDVRKGCYVYFVIGFLVFALSVLGLYYALRSE